MFDLPALTACVSAQGPVVRVVVAKADGSTPREAGASMLVWHNGQSGTIGGGTLEYEAAARARKMLGEPKKLLKAEPLGPALGQCCGGAVTLAYEVFTAETLPDPSLNRLISFTTAPCPASLKRLAQRCTESRLPAPVTLSQGWMLESCCTTGQPVWIFGGGHVGRALAASLAPLPDFDVSIIDISADRLPDPMPNGAQPILADTPEALLAHAPKGGQHFIMTHCHTLDLKLCHGLLQQGADRIGLIGSATKWARFRKRLLELGHGPAAIARITCPIGDPELGKHPQAIAVSVAADLLRKQKMTNATKDVA